MTQNLRLGSTGTAVTLTSADSDVVTSFTILASAIQNSGNTDWSTDYHAQHIYDNGNTWVRPVNGGDSTVYTAGTPPSQSQYIGNYYNWYTATAGRGLSSSANPSIGNVAYSICPKGWKLPTSDEYTALSNAAIGITQATVTSSYSLQVAPYNFVLTGAYITNTVTNQGVATALWSSTGIAENRVNVFNLMSNWIAPATGTGSTQRHLGYSVRCVAR